MGRIGAVQHSADQDPIQRAKTKKISVESLKTPVTDQGVSQGKKAFYHCNYCNKDICEMIRFKCVICTDFDLCVECFSVGAEVTPHKSNHAYRVMDDLSIPLFCPDWNIDEEILLLEGIEMYGMGNWKQVADYVVTKSKSQCIDHYNCVYMNSPFFPLPDMTRVMGMTREDLAVSKDAVQMKSRFPRLNEDTLKEESLISAGVKIEGPTCRSSSSLSADEGPVMSCSSGNTTIDAVKKAASSMAQVVDDIKVEADRRIGEKKPRSFGDVGACSMAEISGYNPKRQEFEIEYDNDAEQLVAEMEFRDSDCNTERELKLRVLHIYSKRLEERRRRKDFILERDLLYPDPLEQNLCDEEREVYKQYKVFMRFNSKEEHANLIRNIMEEHRICKRIQDLQQARASGCIELKKRNDQ